MSKGCFCFVLPGWLIGIVLGSGGPAGASDGSIVFNRDIRPIFSKHCTACHGGVKAAADVSFVYGESAMQGIEPGDPESSELVRRLPSDDAEERMPPPEHGPALSAREIDLIRKWIKQGAKWSRPWALVPPKAWPVPDVRRTDWPKAGLDAFVLAKMEAKGLEPAPPASPEEWLRRVTFDLIGLPPGPDEYRAFRKAFAQDPERAKETAVDRLLGSPHFGERWAAMWLDLARYADTFGFEKDPHRDIWPWRDWVIRAFNADMPFDAFTIRQLAGDLLPDPGPDDLLATAMHRNTQNNTEGGTDDETFRMAAVLDRVNTTWTIWQGTTFGCVQCHSHPYDPYQQADYYSMVAIFNQTEDCDQNDDYPRLRVAKDPKRRAEAAALEVSLRRRRKALNDEGRRVVEQVGAWDAWVPCRAATTGGKLTIAGDRVDASGTLPVGVVYTLELPARPLTAFRIDIFPDSSDPKRWPERGSVVSKLELFLVKSNGQRVPVALEEVIADTVGGRYDPQESLSGGAGGFGGYPVLEGPRWAVFVLKKPLDAKALEGAQHLEVVLHQQAASNSGVQATPVRHFELKTTSDPKLAAFVASEKRRKAWERWRADRSRLASIDAVLVPVMWERPDRGRRTTRFLIRGNLLTKGDVMEPGVPKVFGVPAPTDRPMNRLDFARWLVSDANPLTARVLANRLWAELFGRGIVPTLDDFGAAGVAPSHPRLLDHLAVRLQRHHRWSIKGFLKELVLSATYGQTACVDAEKRRADPANVFLARGPRQRLTAEMVRDQALVLSGRFAPKLFGKPVFPPQPDGIWRTVYSGAKWTTSKGSDRYRRAIYTYWRRTAGYPALLLFDAPARDVCTAKRVPTNTPLQALVTLNDPAFFELAQGFAESMRQGGRRLEERIAYGYRALTGRAPSDATRAALVELYHRAKAAYEADPKAAAHVAKSAQQAALVLVANTLLNLDVTMMR